MVSTHTHHKAKEAWVASEDEAMFNLKKIKARPWTLVTAQTG